MRRRTSLTLIVAVVMVLAFAAACIAAPALTLNDKPFAVKPDAKGMVSAKAAFKALGCKVSVAKNNVMTITKGKTVIVISSKGVSKNKKQVKATIKAAKGDYLISYASINSLLGVKLKFNPNAAVPVKQTTQTSTQQQTQQQTQTTKQEQTKQQEVTAPGGLTGDKAVAFNLLANSKYSGSAQANLRSKLSKVIIVGNVDMTITAKSTGTSSIIATKGKQLVLGGDKDDIKGGDPMFYEIANGDDDAIVAFLKSADSVSVSGNVITIKKATPTDSVLKFLAVLDSRITYKASDLNVDCKINVENGNVKSITNIVMVGIAHGTNDMPAETTGSIEF